jgi:hypothetical protein
LPRHRGLVSSPTTAAKIYLAARFFTQYRHLTVKRNPEHPRRDDRRVNLLIPASLCRILDEAAELADSDRSKFIRAAVREKIARMAALRRPRPEAQSGDDAP